MREIFMESSSHNNWWNLLNYNYILSEGGGGKELFEACLSVGGGHGKGYVNHVYETTEENLEGVPGSVICIQLFKVRNYFHCGEFA